MAEENSKQRLGRGLAALIGEMDKPAVSKPSDASGESIGGAGSESAPVASDRIVPIESIRPNPNNPRRHFTEAELEDLSQSISEHGVIQPILVRSARPEENVDHIIDYEIIAGERRWRAAQRAGVHSVPILLREVDDRQALELAIIENVQRADLNPVEEALGYRQLMEEHDYKQADLGKVIGKSRSHVANTLRLLNLPDSVQGLLSSGQLSSGHARALIPMEAPEALAKRIIDEGLSVRQVEKLAAQEHSAPKAGLLSASAAPKDADTEALERRLSDALGLKVAINHKANGKGRVTIDYKSLDQLDLLEGKLTS
ncbi:MAG: ParB/RepB/Spo0J family partition protein [Hyphomicrobiales bacterium]|nr:ParB/RepB/Spo0J family partition protein [Hyphomicrobiales bacterium]